jgi:hypothetical protein
MGNHYQQTSPAEKTQEEEERYATRRLYWDVISIMYFYQNSNEKGTDERENGGNTHTHTKRREFTALF